ncbi:MAG: hypothetical protein J3K34DRAFT_418073 [Monoraphidium minutum]|nr:MAG: hypothetical protein J3K34DRAFT_418073 [Monoraphidium minutum]
MERPWSFEDLPGVLQEVACHLKTETEDGAYENLIDSTKEAKSGPWRPYLEAFVLRFSRGLPYDELLERVDSVYDKSALVFSNNFITTVGGTDNAAAAWRYLVAPMKRVDLAIDGIKVRYAPPGTPAAGRGGEGVLELEVMSEQRWHLPALLVLVRWVFGDVLTVRVSSISPATGRVVHQHDSVHNWLCVPLPLRVLLGLWLPLLTVFIKP